MSDITYKNESFVSKAEVIRRMYDNKEVNLSAESKKKAAEFLGMTVQTVHATLKKYMELTGVISKPITNNKPSTENKNKHIKITNLNQETTTTSNQQMPDTDMDNDDGDGYSNLTRPKKGQIFITSAPNRYGLPVTNPPIEIRTNEYEN